MYVYVCSIAYAYTYVLCVGIGDFFFEMKTNSKGIVPLSGHRRIYFPINFFFYHNPFIPSDRYPFPSLSSPAVRWPNTSHNCDPQ